MTPYVPLTKAQRDAARRWLPTARDALTAAAHRNAMTALANATRSTNR